MRLFPLSLEIDDNEGFSPEKDIFERKKIGIGLANLLSATSDPLVLAVNGQWGCGKSTFLKMWAGLLRSQGFPVIYFDAFEHDYIADAFSALAGEVIELAQSKKIKSAARKKIKDTAVAASKVLLKAGLIVGAKVTTAGILSAADIGAIADDAKDAVGDATKKLVEDMLTSRNKDRKTLEAFRSALATLPKLLSSDVDSLEETKPLVLIIDELDRCRPTFALEVLERIKHFFSVPGVHFVLGVHLDQLEISVAATYGSGCDARTYLQKFLTLTVDLDSQFERDVRSTTKFLNYLQKTMEFPKDDQDTLNYSVEIIDEVAQKHSLSLRAVERIMTHLAIALTYTKKGSMRVPPILAGLCVMRVGAPDLFRKAKLGSIVYSDVEKFFSLDQRPDDKNTSRDWFKGWWRYCLDPSVDEKFIQDYSSALFHFAIRDRPDVVRITANSVIDRFLVQS